MNIGNILIAAGIALGFVGWPIIGHYSKAGSMWVGNIVMIGTAVVFALLSFNQYNGAIMPGWKALVFLGIATLVNGLAIFFYTAKATNPAINTAVFVVTVSVLMVVIAPLLHLAINHIMPTWRQGAGYILAIAAIYFLNY